MSAAPQRTAELSLGDVGHTALLYAALAGQTHVVQQLVEGGANVDARSALGFTGLLTAAANGRLSPLRIPPLR